MLRVGALLLILSIAGPVSMAQALAGKSCQADSDIGSIPYAGCSRHACYTWRNAKCVSTVGFCVCEPGQCILDGSCVNKGDTSKVTGGTCKIAGCNAWRHATCTGNGPLDNSQCLCAADESAVAGECVAKNGGCPKYTGYNCHWFNTACGGGATCSSDANCECAADECVVDGACQKASDAVIELSRSSAEVRNQNRSEAAAPFAFFAVAFLAASALITVVVRARQASQQPDTMSNYIQVE